MPWCQHRAGQISKGKSPVAQLGLKALGEYHQEQGLKQRLDWPEKEINESQVVLTV